MTDSLTNNYSLTQPLVGGDTNTWGGVLNNGTIAAADAALGNTLAVTMTSSNVDLTTSQFQNKVFVVSGTLTGNYSLVIPLSPNSASVACGGEFIVVNNTSGAYNLTVASAGGGNSVTVPQGFTANLYSDGTNIGYCSNGLPGFALASNGNPNGQLAGTAGSVNTNASLAFDYTNGIFYVCTTTGTSSTAVWSQPAIVTTQGMQAVANLGITVTHTVGNLLQAAFTQSNGSNATSVSPIIATFQGVSGANTTGLTTTVNVTGALSMTTNATGATLGTSNNTPFRIWFAFFNNAETIVPAMMVCTIPGAQYPIAENGVASTTGISGSATSAGVWYTPNGTALTNCAFRVIGYCEYTSGLTTAGTYTTNPNNTVVYSVGTKLPGETVQRLYTSNSTYSQVSVTNYSLSKSSPPTTANGASCASQAITPSSAVNLINVRAKANFTLDGLSSAYTIGFLYNGSTVLQGDVQYLLGNYSATLYPTPTIFDWSGIAGSVSPVTYTVYGGGDGTTVWVNGLDNTSAGNWIGGTLTSWIVVEEIMA